MMSPAWCPLPVLQTKGESQGIFVLQCQAMFDLSLALPVLVPNSGLTKGLSTKLLVHQEQCPGMLATVWLRALLLFLLPLYLGNILQREMQCRLLDVGGRLVRRKHLLGGQASDSGEGCFLGLPRTMRPPSFGTKYSWAAVAFSG